MVAGGEINASLDRNGTIRTSTPLQYPFTTPTYFTMQRGVCVTPRDIWGVYLGIAYTTTQGTDWCGYTVTGARRQTGDGTVHPLYAIKEEDFTTEVSLQPLPKPLHPNVTALHQVFYHDATVSFVYEEMDLSLTQLFSRPLQPSILYSGKSQQLIGAVFKQVCTVLTVESYRH